jgi:hypothetical protein
MLAQPTPALLKPPRLSFAQVCIWCQEHGCESPRCVDKHAASLWTVCDQCGGVSCDCCAFGLMEATAEQLGLLVGVCA